MKSPHLRSAGVAVVLLMAFLAGGSAYACSVESRYVHVLAPRLLPMNIQGSALQRSAFQQPDLLPIYGSSELMNLAETYGAVKTFGTYPTGFAPYQVADAGVTSLIMAQAIAGVGPDVRGRKVVISFTPAMFSNTMVKPIEYGWFYSPLHANELIFSTQLSIVTKQMASKRMLVYRDTINSDRILRFALNHLVGDSPLDIALYVLVWPLGKLQTLLLNVQDHRETLALIDTQKNLSVQMPRRSAPIDWAALKVKAEREQVPYANNNPYGFDNVVWSKYFQGGVVPQPAASGDIGYEYKMETSAEWTDLDLLLRVLTEVDAKPLLLSRPVNGAYWNAMGVSQDARNAYYAHLHALAQQYRVPVVDFKAQEMDKYFSVDTLSHTSRKGWVYVNEALDAFYHGRLQ